MGDLTLCQRINDADWKRTDMQSVSGGIFAGAIGTGLSGLLGGIGQSTFSSKVQAEVSFDAFNLDIDIRYDGKPMEFSSGRPTEDALLADEKAVASLSGFLIRHYADRVKAETANGRCRIQMHFDH